MREGEEADSPRRRFTVQGSGFGVNNRKRTTNYTKQTGAVGDCAGSGDPRTTGSTTEKGTKQTRRAGTRPATLVKHSFISLDTVREFSYFLSGSPPPRMTSLGKVLGGK
jgi:hypothetical protein